MPAARIVAQAKINLFLRVLAREASGYHQIESLFCRLALGDTVIVRATDGPRSLQCTGEWMPAGGIGPAEENLAWRAAAAYGRHAGWPVGFAVEIDKRIPIGAGLGGGSADAGAVLRGLNALNPTPLPRSALLALAGSLGADVPFLTQDSAPLALGWGRGDRLLPVAPLPERSCFLFNPGIPVSTRDAYGWLADQAPSPMPALIAAESLTSWHGIATLAHNDLEDVVGEHYPGVASALAALRSPTAQALVGTDAIIQMSGSGSTLFALSANDVAGKDRFFGWRSDEPGFSVIATSTASRVEPVVMID